MQDHPYSRLPAHKFWKSAVADQSPLTVSNFYKRKFEIKKDDRVATAGSCFAQHVARHMKARGFTIVDVEPPLPGMASKTAQRFGYGIYSARYANIYTIRQLRQLVEDALALQASRAEVPLDRILRAEDVMERNGRYFDGLRPNVEPEGFAHPDEVHRSREAHLRRVLEMFTSMDVFVFTFGLTETWRNRRTGTVYPVCPGVLAGTFSSEDYEFFNMTQTECLSDFALVYEKLRLLNPGLRFLVTVSPVPLTATASDSHVLTATTYSKSVLRRVCGEISDKFEDVDYFPSYELITAPFTKGRFFERNMRSVTERGVSNVMRVFFDAHDPTSVTRSSDKGSKSVRGKLTPAEREQRRLERRAVRKTERRATRTAAKRRGNSDEVMCEEELLDAFRK